MIQKETEQDVRGIIRMMRCIFCKEDSTHSKSVEHIIPEALGNKEHLLPKGVVCDHCNNYFARKIEAPLLSSLHFQNLRGRQRVPNKRNIVPPERGVLAPGVEIELQWHGPNNISLSASRQAEEDLFIKYFQNAKSGTLYIPLSVPIDDRLMSRFLGKVGVEVLAKRTLGVDGWNKEIVDNPQLDLLRFYVRYNKGGVWPFNQRQIYDENYIFDDGYQVMHEYTILVTPEEEFYLILCIFGIEYTINLGGPELNGYKKWLSDNKGKSPLYGCPEDA